ncbi:MAG: transglycosylase SLT domain-containing protein [Rudaea sp.]
MPTRDWRLAALGGGCMSLGAICLFLAACSGVPRKPETAPVANPAQAVSGQPAIPAPAASTVAVEISPWTRLRASFALADCDYSPEALQIARWFSANPSSFAESLRQSLPFLLLVSQRIHARGLPGEFALLPWIESNYTPLATSGDRAAGIWQLMPDTAREAGLRIDREYDGRLDITASTDAALDLLTHYHERFGDWRVADLAFNAGEYRIAALLRRTDVPASAAGLRRLRVDAHTHRHLAKLLGAACIVVDPARFDVRLPEPGANDNLTEFSLPAPLNLQLAARMAGMDATRLRQLNPGYRQGFMPERGPFHLLLPQARRLTLAAALARVPQPLWRDWHEITLAQAESVDVLANANDIGADALAAANTVAADATLPSGTRVLIPGRGGGPAPVDAAAATAARVQTTSSDWRIVRAGDTLWRIARAAHVALTDLLHWNGLRRDATLRPGQRLRLQAADASGGAAAITTASPD